MTVVEYIDIAYKLWPIAVGLVGLIIVFAKMHHDVKILKEKVKTLFQLLNASK